MFESDILGLAPGYLDGVIAQRKQYLTNITASEIKAAFDNAFDNALSRAASKFKNVKGSIAMLPLRGFISHRASMWSEMGFESSSETFGMWMDAVMNDASIGAIIIDVNSLLDEQQAPGG